MSMPVQMSTFKAPYSALSVPIMTPKVALSEPSASKKRRCSRKVNFGADKTLAHIESSLEFTQEEKDDRWYRSSEISTFKTEARHLCRSRTGGVSNSCRDASIPKHSARNDDDKDLTSVTRSDGSDNSKESARGLDVYYPSRQRFCKRFIQHVLEAYHVRCAGNDEHVSLLAEKWSKKSLNRAIDMAKKDFLAAYFPYELDYESLSEDSASTLVQSAQQKQGPQVLTTSA